MKPLPHLLFILAATAIPHLLAAPAARILGELPVATLSTDPKPGFTVKPTDLISSQVHHQGGRTITLSEIKPIALPTRLKPTPPALTDPAVQQRLQNPSTDPQDAGLILAGATVFRLPDGTARSLVTLTSATTAETVTFLSSADFGLLASISAFTGTDGKNRSLILSWSTEPCDTPTDLATRLQHHHGLKKLPKLPPGTPSYALLAGNPDPATRTALQSLHQIYTTEHPRLLAAHQASLLQQTTLNSAAPPPKNLTLHHWQIGTTQGGVQ
jgi:hypothetical protein